MYGHPRAAGVPGTCVAMGTWPEGPQRHQGCSQDAVRCACRAPALTDRPLSGEAAAVDAEAACQHLFARTPSELFHSPLLAFELIRFCRDNLPLFSRNLGVLKLSFPNLFKACSPDPGPESGLGCLDRGAPCPWALLSTTGSLGACQLWPQDSGQVAGMQGQGPGAGHPWCLYVSDKKLCCQAVPHADPLAKA